MTMQWHALRSKPRKEITLWRQLQSRQVENFFPAIRVNPVNPRSSHVRPYFPGYMFVRTDLEREGQSKFNFMPYSIGLVSFGGEAAKVPADFILALKKRMAEIAEAGGELFYDMNRGDPVWITNGPFEGYRAIFDTRLRGEDRVRVLLEMLSDQLVPLEMNAAFIEKARNVRQAYRH